MAGESYEMTRRRVLRKLKAMAAAAQQEGVMLCLEPLNVHDDHPGYWLTTMAQAADLVEEVDLPSLKILYDIYHQQITEGSILANLRKYAPRIGHIHVAGAPGRGNLVGGDLDYRTIFAAIDDVGYDGYVGLEFRPNGDYRSRTCRGSRADKQAVGNRAYMLVLHAHWQPPARPDENGTVLFWTETSAAPAEQNNPSQVDSQDGRRAVRVARSTTVAAQVALAAQTTPAAAAPAHPFCASLAESEEALRQLGWAGGGRQGTLTLLLPAAGNLPRPSPQLVYDWPFDMRRSLRLARWQVQGLLLPPAAAMAVLLALPPDSDLPPSLRVADDARYWATATGPCPGGNGAAEAAADARGSRRWWSGKRRNGNGTGDSSMHAGLLSWTARVMARAWRSW